MSVHHCCVAENLGAQSVSTQQKWSGLGSLKVFGSSCHLRMLLQLTADEKEPKRKSGCWRLESDQVFCEWSLDHSVSLPVRWRWQDGARFEGKFGHIFRVFSYRRPYVSILLIEKLGGTSLCSVRCCLV